MHRILELSMKSLQGEHPLWAEAPGGKIELRGCNTVSCECVPVCECVCICYCYCTCPHVGLCLKQVEIRTISSMCCCFKNIPQWNCNITIITTTLYYLPQCASSSQNDGTEKHFVVSCKKQNCLTCVNTVHHRYNCLLTTARVRRR